MVTYLWSHSLLEIELRSVPVCPPTTSLSNIQTNLLPSHLPPTVQHAQINNHKLEVFITEITVVGLNRKINAFIITHWEDKAGCGLVLVAGIYTQRLSLRSWVRRQKS